MADQGRENETELEVIEIVESDGYRERSISMIIPRDSVVAELSPLETVDDLTDEDQVEWLDDDHQEIHPSEVTDLDRGSHSRSATSGIQIKPPNLGRDAHPFHIYAAAVNAAEARTRLGLFERWHGLQERVTAELGVSRAVIARARLRILSDMMHYGLAASEAVLSIALDVGLAPSREHLIGTLRSRFEATVDSPTSSGLTKTQVRDNWAALQRLEASGLHARSGGETK